MKVLRYTFDVVREPLRRPFSFKGGSFREKWITETGLELESGIRSSAIGGLAVLWSDPEVFSAHSETGGNILMCAIAEYAASLVSRTNTAETRRPDTLLDILVPPVYQYAKSVTVSETLRKTFVLNSLVSLDLALWKAYFTSINARQFDDILPAFASPALQHRHSRIAHIPLISYGIPIQEIQSLAENGTFLFKIKLGQQGTQEEMLRKDCKRLSEIHRAIGSYSVPHAPGGKIRYYLDANGRYQKKETLLNLFTHIDDIGMLDQVFLLEEPFAEGTRESVSDLPVRTAADESAETPEDIALLAQLGYGAIALKPAGKTLSAALGIASAAYKHGIPCFTADSACVPILVDWNKNIAARLAPLPELGIGMLESNGPAHYRHWQHLLETHPCKNAEWLIPKKGMYHLNEEFYQQSGGIFY